MANGATALHLALASESKDAAAPAPASAEDQVGAALVALAAVSVQSFQEVTVEGRMRAETKNAGGTLIAELYQTRQTLGAVAFDAMARRQGSLRLQRHGVALSAAVVDDLLAIVLRVDATMRAWAN